MTRRATIRTTHDDPALVAATLAPDNTAEMDTDRRADAVVTRIERETTGGLHATVDDYVVNVDVATTVAQHANHQPEGADSTADPADPAGTAGAAGGPSTRTDASAPDSDDQSNHE